MYTLLVPKQNSLREVKPGRKGPFWKSFWEKRVRENPDYFKGQYEQRLKKLSAVTNSFTSQQSKNDKKYYLEAKLDSSIAKTKSSQPDMLWKESGVQVVESREGGIITLSGSSEDFSKLDKLLEGASFETAAKLDKVNKAGNLSREIFSVTALADKNTSIDKRISADIRAILGGVGSGKFECILTIYFDQPKSDYDSLYSILTSKIDLQSIRKVDPRFFISNMSFRANFNKSEIEKILVDEDCNFISFIKLAPIFGSQRTTPNTDAKSIIIGTVLTDEKIVVIDSGISHQSLNGSVYQRENFLNSGEIADKNHGTAVTSRILFGENIFSRVDRKEAIDPVGKIIDIQVLHKNSDDEMVVDDQTLIDAVQTGVRKYSDQATLFNLSIAERQQVDELNVSEISEMIDTLSNKEDVLFICPTGNQNSNFALGYEKIFNTTGIDAHIAAPSDAINALTVGAITEVADGNSICSDSKHPSPFARKGGIRNDIKKPELVAYGGNIKTDSTDKYSAAHLDISRHTYGVELIDSNGFNRDVGSSFSAPLITREAVQLLDYLKKSSLPTQLPTFKENKANLIKALLIHSTSRVPQTLITDNGLKRAYGFGQANFQSVIKDNSDQVTIVYADKISFKEKKQKILVNLPQHLLGKHVEFSFTLVYNPPVNRNFKEYKMIELDPSLSFLTPVIDKDGVAKNKSGAINPSPSWEAYRSSHFNTVHFTRERKRITKLDLQIMVEMLISNRLLEDYAGNEAAITQNYALVLTIKDKTQSGVLRSEILSSNQFFELIENTVQVQTTG